MVSTTIKEEPIEAEASLWSGGVYVKAEVHNTKMERRLLGKNFRLLQRVLPAAYARQGRVNRRRRDEAAAKNENHEGFSEKLNQEVERTPKIDGGSLSCGRQIVRRRGSIQNENTLYLSRTSSSIFSSSLFQH